MSTTKYNTLIIDPSCDAKFANAIKSFCALAESSELYVGVRKKSIFKVIETSLDDAFQKHYSSSTSTSRILENFFKSFRPSLMKDPAPFSSFKHRERKNDYDIAISVLDGWVDYFTHLTLLCDDDSQSAAIHTLRNLNFYLRQFKPRTKKLPFDETRKFTKRVQADRTKIEKFCKLCWRETARYQDMQKALTTVNQGNYSKYDDLSVEEENSYNTAYSFAVNWDSSPILCTKHQFKTRDDSPSKINVNNAAYTKANRRKEDFQRELYSALNPGSSEFLPNSDWFVNFFPGLSEMEHRHIVYKLVHSELNSKTLKIKRRDILEGLARRDTKETIAEKVGITVNAINKQIVTIRNTIRWILQDVHLDKNGDPLRENSHLRRLDFLRFYIENLRLSNQHTSIDDYFEIEPSEVIEEQWLANMDEKITLLVQALYYRYPVAPALDDALFGIRLLLNQTDCSAVTK
jgi:hypothetical protein